MNGVVNKTRLAEKRPGDKVEKKEFRKQNDSIKERKQNGKKQKRQNIIDEDFDLG